MLFSKISSKVKIIKRIDTSSLLWCNAAYLISLKGTGALKNEISYYKNDYMHSSILTLNETPLIQSKLPGCSTCAGLLATGYGIENANCDELHRIRDSINSDFIDLDTSLDILSPLLNLLESGLYVIADIEHYPTDGNNNFFWNVPNKMTLNPATGAARTEDFSYACGAPTFLYPSESTEFFNEERVSYYIDRFCSSDNRPRAIAYHLSEYISVLLDGHHKATAAALHGEPISCITIIPASCTSYKAHCPTKIESAVFGSFLFKGNDIPAHLHPQLKASYTEPKCTKPYTTKNNLLSKEWSSKYLSTTSKYPSLTEVGESLMLNIGDMTDELIEHCLNNLTHDNAIKLKYIIAHLSRFNDPRTKTLSLTCAKLTNEPILLETSFKALNKIKDDADVEQFFIDFLIDSENDPYSTLITIANGYWGQ